MNKEFYMQFLEHGTKDVLVRDMMIKLYIFCCVVSLSIVYISLDFPNEYNWGELFISYEGGFIRRGLLGQILYFFAPYISMHFFVLFLYTCLFFTFLYISYKYAVECVDTLTLILIFIAPSLFFFHLKDYYVFLKKDIFIELSLLCMCIVCAKYIIEQKQSLFLHTLIFITLYAVAFLIHEMMLFYFPLPFLLLGISYAQKRILYIWFLLGVAIISASLAVIFYAGGTLAQRDTIAATWQALYPHFVLEKTGLRYVGADFMQVSYHSVAAYHTNAVSMRSALWGLCLALIPLGFMVAGYNSFANIRRVLGSRILWFFFWLALATPWIMPVFFNDFGRHISVACFTYVFFLLTVQHIAPQPCAAWLQRWNNALQTSLRARFWCIAWVLVYGTGWMLMGWMPLGKSYVQPTGVLFFLRSVY